MSAVGGLAALRHEFLVEGDVDDGRRDEAQLRQRLPALILLGNATTGGGRDDGEGKPIHRQRIADEGDERGKGGAGGESSWEVRKERGERR